MACIKCGKKAKEPQVFCDECLAEAEKYPVNPATPIQIPTYTAAAVPKKKGGKRKPAQSPEEQLPRLRSSVRILTLALMVIMAAFCLTALMLIHLLDQRDHPSAVQPTPAGTVESIL